MTTTNSPNPMTNFGIALDLLGNVYTMGKFACYSVSFDTITVINQNAGQDDYYFVKFDSIGNTQWAIKPTVTGTVLTSDYHGNIYLLSATTLIKYSSNGNILWTKQILVGSANNSYTFGVDSHGNVITTGVFNTPQLNIGTYTLTNNDQINGHNDIYLIKYDTSGSVVWAKNFGGSYDDAAVLKIDHNDNICMTGEFESPVINIDTFHFQNVNPIYSDIFFLKLDPSGNILWAKSTGSANSDSHGYIAIDELNNIYMTGGCSNCMIDTFTTSNSMPFTVKFDTSGNALWLNTFNLGYYAINCDINNNLYATGVFQSDIMIGPINLIYHGSSGHDPFIVKYDTNGNVIWAKSGTANGWTEIWDLKISHSLDCYVSGTNQGSITFDNTTLPCPAPWSSFVAKLSESTSTIVLKNNYNFVDYVSSSNNSINVKFRKYQNGNDVRLIIYDAMGRNIKEYLPVINNEEYSIDISSYQFGVYILKMQCMNLFDSFKFIKQ